MKKIILALLFLNYFNLNAQNKSNKGKDFWLGCPTSPNITQDMTIYLSCENLPVGLNYATVTITIDSSSVLPNNWWQRTYHLTANTVIDIAKTTAFSFAPASALAIGPLPNGPSFNCFLSSPACPSGNGGTGIFANKGIHITSDANITVIAHLHGPTSSGATILVPTSSWGNSYTIVNSAQNSAQGDANFFFVIANEDSTRIKITASNSSSATANCQSAAPTPFSPYIVELQKGQIYQYLGYTNITTSNGVELTGSKIQSIPNINGVVKKIGVFAGSSRTGGESGTTCTVGSRDNDLQQCYPENTWGKKFVVVPFVTSSGTSINTSSFSGVIYKIIAKDTGTVVAVDGALPIAISTNSSYKFSSSTLKYVQANKPVMIAQFMTSGNCNTGYGDPEMIYLSPLEQAINSVAFYRTNVENISNNFVNIIIPDSGIATLKIDDLGQSVNWGGDITIITHPTLSGYKVVVKGWTASNKQCIITSNAKFNAFTYGLGAAESYGFNCGMSLEDLTPKLNISGLLISPSNKKINKCQIALIGGTTANTTSDSIGFFSINTVEGNYTLRTTKNNDITKANGLTSVDVLLAQRHILNISKLNSPYKIIAADVTGDKQINSTDVLRMKRLILGTDTTFTSATRGSRLWEFVDSAYVFPDTTNPFPFKDSISFTNLTSNKTNQTFIGVKLGDVNYDWNPTVARGVAVNSLELIVNSEKTTNNNLQLAFTCSNFSNINALQTTLHFDNTKYQFVSIESNKLQIDYNATKANTTGNIAVLWTDKNAEAKSFNAEDVLFTVILKPRSLGIENLELVVNNNMVETEAWDNNFTKHSIVLSKKETNHSSLANNQLLIYPNPAKGNVTIQTDGARELMIIDYLGRIISKQSLNNKSSILNIELISGIYIVQAMMLDGSIRNEKVIVE